MTEYRNGSHNTRNIYRAGVDRDTDEHIGVMFTPETARLVAIALNVLCSHDNGDTDTETTETTESTDQESLTCQPEPATCQSQLDMSAGAVLHRLADAFTQLEAITP